MLPGQQLAEKAGERVQVIAPVGRLAGQQLARGVGRGVFRPRPARAPEVQDSYLAGFREQDVLRLEIRMHHPSLVRVRDSLADLPDDGPGRGSWQRLAGELLQDIGKQFSVQPFHREEVEVAVPVE